MKKNILMQQIYLNIAIIYYRQTAMCSNLSKGLKIPVLKDAFTLLEQEVITAQQQLALLEQKRANIPCSHDILLEHQIIPPFLKNYECIFCSKTFTQADLSQQKQSLIFLGSYLDGDDVYQKQWEKIDLYALLLELVQNLETEDEVTLYPLVRKALFPDQQPFSYQKRKKMK